MNVLLIGSCRVKRQRVFVKENDVAYDLVEHHVHNPYEIIQLFQFAKGANPSLYLTHDVLHNEIAARSNISSDYYEDLRAKFYAADLFLIELSSLKRNRYVKDLSELDCNLTALKAIDRSRFSAGEFFSSTLNQDAFSSAVENIIELCLPRKIIFIPHFPFISESGGSLDRKKMRDIFFVSMKLYNAKYYDPWEDIERLGYGRCIVDSSHYTVDFEKFLAEKYHEHIRLMFHGEGSRDDCSFHS